MLGIPDNPTLPLSSSRELALFLSGYARHRNSPARPVTPCASTRDAAASNSAQILCRILSMSRCSMIWPRIAFVESFAAARLVLVLLSHLDVSFSGRHKYIAECEPFSISSAMSLTSSRRRQATPKDPQARSMSLVKSENQVIFLDRRTGAIMPMAI